MITRRGARISGLKAGAAIGGAGGRGGRRKWRGSLLSRWIWLYHRGWVPDPSGKYVIDHINNDKLDDRIKNLQVLHFMENLNKDRHPDRPSIFDASVAQRTEWARRGHATQKRLGTGFYDPNIRAKGQTPQARAKAQATRQARGIKSPFADPAVRAKAQATRQARRQKQFATERKNN